MELLNILSVFGLIMLFFFGLLLVGFRKLSHNEWKELKAGNQEKNQRGLTL